MAQHARRAYAAALCLSAACSVVAHPPAADSTASASGRPASAAATKQRLCDGTARVRLRYYLAGGGLELDGSWVRIDNGFPSFMLDGTCQYWIGGGWNDYADPLARDRGWRTGVASTELMTALDQVAWSALGELADCDPHPGLFDAGSRVIAADGSIACASKGPKFDALWGIIETRGKQLWDAATPVTGDIHVAASQRGSTDAKLYTWPIAEPIAKFLVTPFVNFEAASASQLVSNPTEAAKLRALLAQYIADIDAGAHVYDGPRVSDGTTTATLYARDALPYEDEHGWLPRPE